MTEYLTLGEVCTKGSSNIAQKELDGNEGEYEIYGASGLIKKVNFFHQDKPYIAVVKDGAGVGRTMLLPAKSSVIGTMQYIIPCDNVDIEYLYYAITYMDLSRYYMGAAIPHIYFKDYKKEKLPIPDIDTQKRIAAKFRLVDKLITFRRSQLTKLSELTASRFLELFGEPETNPKGWQRQRFDELCEILDSRRIPITSTDRKAGIYPYYGASGIVDYVEDYIFDEELLLISEDGANLVMRTTPIAFSISGKTWVNNHAHVARFGSRATQKYIEVCFALIDISGSITGTAQPKLNQAKLNAMLFCMPPIELQEQFAAFVTQTDKSKLAVQKSLEQLETLKKSLMQKYFG